MIKQASSSIFRAIAFGAAAASSAQFHLDALTGTASSAMAASMRIRKSSDRGFSDHGWLKSRFSFSFADYYDPAFSEFGPLRVINEDWVAPGQGFDTHPHRNFEIFSYILEGSLRHTDSMGHVEVIKRGQVQFTSAGTGIMHSEYNASPSEPVRFLQMWLKPHTMGLKPRYATATFTDEDKLNRLRLFLSPDGREGSIAVSQDADVFACLLEDGTTVEHVFRGSAAAGAAAGAAGAGGAAGAAAGRPRRGYLHLPIMAGTKGLTVVSGSGATAELAPGDGLFIEGEASIKITGHAHADKGTKAAEFILYDMA